MLGAWSSSSRAGDRVCWAPGPRRAAEREKIGSSSREGTWASSSSTEGEDRVERKRWGSSERDGARAAEREKIGFCERDGARFFFHRFSTQKYEENYFHSFSIIFHEIFFYIFFPSFFFTPNKGKKLTFLIFFFHLIFLGPNTP